MGLCPPCFTISGIVQSLEPGYSSISGFSSSTSISQVEVDELYRHRQNSGFDVSVCYFVPVKIYEPLGEAETELNTTRDTATVHESWSQIERGFGRMSHAPSG
jgi:hypothetical protein